MKTLKTSMGDLLTRLNENRIEIDEILNNLKEKKDNFNLASNMASIAPIIRSPRKEGEDYAQVDQMQEDLEDLKHYVESKLMEINIKIDMLSSNNPNIADFNKNIPEESLRTKGERTLTKLKTLGPNKIELSSSGVVGTPHLMKKIEEVDKNNRNLERSFKRLLSSFNVNDVLDDIAKLKDTKADKTDIPDSDSFNYLLDDIKVKIKKFYLTKDEFDKYIKPKEGELVLLNKEMSKAKDYISQLMNTIKKKVDINDLSSIKGNLSEKIEELARACNLKFADKNECLKNFKHIEEQLKKILFILQKKSDQNSEGEGNWLLAKKPINGYACAACESYIGELNNDIKKYVPWNRLPYRDSGDNLYRMGNGYSKMLQMINFDNNGNVNISPDNSDDRHTIVSNDSNGMNSFNIHGINNNMGKTFYPKQKNSQSKTSAKFRVQSAQDGNGERTSNISIKNSNNLEENKINLNLGNNTKTRNQKGLPKINFMEIETSSQKDPRIKKKKKKSQSKNSFKITGKKF